MIALDYLTLIELLQELQWSLMIAGLAGAVGYYFYSRMNEQEKREMVNNLKEKGKKLYDEYMPGKMKNMVAAQ